MNNKIFPEDWQWQLEAAALKKDGCRRKAYICSPLSALTKSEMLENIRRARAYMFYANTQMQVISRAPHAYLPFLLCDDVPAERAIALRFGLELLEQCDVLLVCGNKLSKGMEGEIGKAASLKMPIQVFDKETHLSVKRIVTHNGADKHLVSLIEHHRLMGSCTPEEDAREAVMECYANSRV